MLNDVCLSCSAALQAYAAMTLALEPKNMDCTYVGNVPLAKSYGLQKVYRLHRTTLSV